MGAAERNDAKRAQWHRIIRNIAADRLIFVDESGANRTLARRYGRAPRAERCHGSAPRNYRENLTLFASLSLRGMETAMLIDGAADTASFQVYIEQILVPTLRPGQRVIIDNLAVHKQPAIKRAIEAASCRVVFLPSYSPDFNPIEQAFSKIKAYLRRVGVASQDALEAAIGEAIELIAASDATGYFRHCGYITGLAQS